MIFRTNGQSIARAKHLEDVANASKCYILAEILDVTNAVAKELESIGGNSDALDTVPYTVDGGLWYEMLDGAPVLKLRKGSHEISFKSDEKTAVGDNSKLVSYLPCDTSITADTYGNTWSATGNPKITSSPDGTGNALYLTTADWLTLDNIPLGGQDFTVDVWVYILSSGSTYARAIEVFKGSADNSASFAVDRVPRNEWAHLALVYHNDTGEVKGYVNGQYLFTDSRPVWQTRQTAGCGVYIGESVTHSSSERINAYVKKFRIFDGIALWSENFTPPTADDYE